MRAPPSTRVLVPAEGELGQVQPDQGNGHVQAGDKVTYPVCPPASGKHINKTGFGPLQPRVYGPDDQSLPNGWVHNLEHGGLVLLYSCDQGACDEAGIEALRARRRPASRTARYAPSRRASSGRSSRASSRCPRGSRPWCGTAPSTWTRSTPRRSTTSTPATASGSPTGGSSRPRSRSAPCPRRARAAAGAQSAGRAAQPSPAAG